MRDGARPRFPNALLQLFELCIRNRDLVGRHREHRVAVTNLIDRLNCQGVAFIRDARNDICLFDRQNRIGGDDADRRVRMLLLVVIAVLALSALRSSK